MTSRSAKPRRRGTASWAVAALILVTLWTVPRAAAAGDPYDPASPGSPDFVPAPEDGQLCLSKPLAPAPGFVAPDGLPTLTGCTRAKVSPTSITASGTNYTGVATTGIQGAPHLGQWIKIPVATSVSVVPIHLNVYKPDLTADPPGTNNNYIFYPRVWFVSADRKRVGEMPPFTVKSLAFGAIPVEVTVHITQPRLSDGTVEPLKVRQANPINFTGGSTGNDGRPNVSLVRNASGGGRVDVRLSDATVDGVPLDLGSGCHTSSAAVLTLTGDGFQYNGSDSTKPVPPGKYNGARGGLLHGTIDIPAFSGCRSATGDDVSPLLSNLVSGSGSPIALQQTVASSACYPQFNNAVCQAGLTDPTYPTDLPVPVPPPAG